MIEHPYFNYSYTKDHVHFSLTIPRKTWHEIFGERDPGDISGAGKALIRLDFLRTIIAETIMSYIEHSKEKGNKIMYWGGVGKFIFESDLNDAD